MVAIKINSTAQIIFGSLIKVTQGEETLLTYFRSSNIEISFAPDKWILIVEDLFADAEFESGGLKFWATQWEFVYIFNLPLTMVYYAAQWSNNNEQNSTQR